MSILGETHDDNLAGNDQAASQSQSELEVWKQKYAGLNGKLLTVQTQLSEAKAGLLDERTKWDAERQQILQQSTTLQNDLSSAQSQLTDLMSKFNTVAAQAETVSAQAARQKVMLKYPHLVSDPIMKLVETSTLNADELEATLSSMAQGQQQLVKQVYQEVQSGSTSAVAPAAMQGNAKQEQAETAKRAAIEALAKGDFITYRSEYAKFIQFADQTGQSVFKAPTVLASQPI